MILVERAPPFPPKVPGVITPGMLLVLKDATFVPVCCSPPLLQTVTLMTTSFPLEPPMRHDPSGTLGTTMPGKKTPPTQ